MLTTHDRASRGFFWSVPRPTIYLGGWNWYCFRPPEGSESNMRQVENQVAEVHREKNELSTHLWHVMEELKTSERRNVELEGKQYRQTKD